MTDQELLLIGVFVFVAGYIVLAVNATVQHPARSSIPFGELKDAVSERITAFIERIRQRHEKDREREQEPQEETTGEA